MNKKWQYKESDVEVEKKFIEEFGISKTLARILVSRGITKSEQVRIFLNPTRNDFYDPYLLPDMNKAVDRILESKKNKEDILIYGDYDVDGITSIAVLKKFLELIGINSKGYIPNRLDEGYGLNKEAIDEIAKDGYKLMITVDCGISGIEEVKYASSLGIETIITDHHEPLEKLPKAVAVIDPKIKNSKYPFTQLARSWSCI